MPLRSISSSSSKQKQDMRYPQIKKMNGSPEKEKIILNAGNQESREK